MSQALGELHVSLGKLREIAEAFSPMAQSLGMDTRKFQDIVESVVAGQGAAAGGAQGGEGSAGPSKTAE